jgi:hypothetical protein
MNLFYIRKQGLKGLAGPFPLHPKSPPKLLRSLRTVPLDDSEHLLHNQHASVASLRLLFTFERNTVRLPPESAFAFTGIPTKTWIHEKCSVARID